MDEAKQEAVSIALTDILHAVSALADELNLSLDDMIGILAFARADVEAMKAASCVPQGELN